METEHKCGCWEDESEFVACCEEHKQLIESGKGVVRMTTGELIKSRGTYGGEISNFFTCIDCHTVYPEEQREFDMPDNYTHCWPEGTGKAKCNGHTISLCPTCRPDSRPWFEGRGI